MSLRLGAWSCPCVGVSGLRQPGRVPFVAGARGVPKRPTPWSIHRRHDVKQRGMPDPAHNQPVEPDAVIEPAFVHDGRDAADALEPNPEGWSDDVEEQGPSPLLLSLVPLFVSIARVS